MVNCDQTAEKNEKWCIKSQPAAVKEQIRVNLYKVDIFRSSGIITCMANEILMSLAITLQNSCEICADLQIPNKRGRSLKLPYFLYSFTIHFFLSDCSSPFLPPRSSIATLLCVFVITMNLNGS